MNLSTLFRAYTVARAKADYAWGMWWYDDGPDRLYKQWKRYAVLSRKLHNRIISGLEAAEKPKHSPQCWKNISLMELGVGGPLASCTCGADKEEQDE